MDAKEILTRFKDGALDRAAAQALLAGGTPATQPAPSVPATATTDASASSASSAASVPAASSASLSAASASSAPAAASASSASSAQAASSARAASSSPATSSAPAAGTDAAVESVAAGEPIAVIGYSARFPGADDADTFWQRILDGDDLVTEVPRDRWRIEEHYDPDPSAEGKSVSKWGAFVSDVDRFDADFFRMPPREAELTDPQARLFLQESWRALEHAGLAPETLAGARCGVHAGVMLNDYQDLIERESPHARLPQVMQGNSNSILAARIAYHLDLKGPAITVDTACSSSLVALHQACQALWLGEADVMLAGGVTLYLTELPYVFMSRAGMLSPTGPCRPFDAAADGIVPGEGCAVVVLKPLAKALADGDTVHAVIAGSGLNQDGRTNGITAPSAASQATLIRDTMRRFAIDPAGIDYVECHGTGTPLGDPIEVTALNNAFAEANLAPGSVPIGSVKGNIGHTSAAAGLAGLLKAIGVVATGHVPPSLHYTRPNEKIPFAEGPFTVAAERRETGEHAGRPRRASVSSFGFSGTNAYVVVEEPPAAARTVTHSEDRPVLVPLSGRRPQAPAAYAADLARWLRGPGADASPADVAHTLGCARGHHPHRAALLVTGRDELLASLDLLAEGAPDARRLESTGTGRPDAAVHRAQAELLARLLADIDGHPRADQLGAVARLYVQGHRIDWTALTPTDRHRRLPLPGYAFARDRHYVTPATDAPAAPAQDAPLPEAAAPVPAGPVLVHAPVGDLAAAPAAAPAVAAQDATDLAGLILQQPVWQDAPLPEAAAPVPAGPVLVHDPVGDLADALAAAGADVHAAGRGEDAQRLAEALRAGGATAVTVILRVLGPRPGDAAGTAAGLAAFETARAALRSLRTQQLTLLAVTTDPTRADAAGALVQTLRQENPRLHGRAVLTVDDGAAAVPALLAELSAPDAEFGHLCDIRNGRRSRRVWAPLGLPTDGAGAEARVDGVHLVTGGLGGVGLTLARHLARRPGTRAVLCGRTSWERLDATARQAVAEHDRLRYVQADVTDPRAAAALVRGILDREGALHSVFHAAGVVRDGYLVRKSPQDIADVLAPKTDGTAALDEATAQLPLDAFVLFSSVAAVTGNLGQSDYAFANGCLDGFAVRRAERVARGERQGRTLSVQWPLWDVPGMTIPDHVLRVVEEHTGMRPLPAGTALAALDHLLAGAGPNVVSLFHGDAEIWQRHLTGLNLTPMPAAAPEISTTATTAAASAPAGSPAVASASAVPQEQVASDAAHRAAVTEAVCRSVAETLGRPPGSIAPRTSLESLGLDSVMIRTVASRLTTDIAPVGPDMLFGLRDVDELVDHLITTLPQPTPRPQPVQALRLVVAMPEAAPQPAAAPTVAAPTPPTTATATATATEDLYAITGLSGRYPQAPDLDAFWRNLVNGKDTVTALPADRWSDAGGVRAQGHFLDGIDGFDPAFFGLSAHESAMLDPQERLFLEVAWEALEDAGYTGSRLDGLVAADGERRSVGVFAGITSSDYKLLGAERWASGHRDMPAGHYWSLANRLSYLLDLRGPSQPVDTACSSSLVALHLALDAMRRGECAAALVGGVNLYVHPSRFRMLRQSGFLAEDGRCRSFGAGGAGFGPGEGAGAVLIKPLARALADGDAVHAVIRGSFVAHSGRTNGFTAPSPTAQARVLREALRRSATDPATVNVIEAHGTGTELGDPVEVAALTAAYGRGEAPCSLGSVKSAVGHGESAAGIAALTKVVLQLRHGRLAPTLHADPVNPNLRLEDTRFTLQHTEQPWQRLTDADGTPLPRRAGISSFGAGGVNAHVIVEEFVPERYGRPATEPRPGPQLVVVSAPTPQHLTATAGRLASWLRGTEATGDLAAVARALRTGRAAMDCRLAVVAQDTAELAATLADFADNPDGPVRAADLRDGRGTRQRLGEAPETGAFVAELWRNGRLRQLADLWLAGLDVDWSSLDATAPAAPLASLPPSAFLRRSLWLDGPRDDAGTNLVPAAVAIDGAVTRPAPEALAFREPEAGPEPRPAADPVAQDIAQRAAAQPKPEAPAVPEREAARESGSGSVTGSESGSVTVSETGPESGAVTRSESGSVTGSESAPESGSVTEPATAPESGPETEPATAPEADPDSDLATTPETDPAPDPLTADIAQLVGMLVPGADGPAPTDRSLLDLGIDSINVMNLRFELTERYGRTLPLQLLSESSITELVAHLTAPAQA
ncbi:SDR family NAD(P)-dependent oxidoreductase [Streptomyces sp. NPDC001709]